MIAGSPVPKSPGVEAELSTSGRIEPDLGSFRGAYALLDPAYPITPVRGRAGRVALVMGGRVIIDGEAEPFPRTV